MPRRTGQFNPAVGVTYGLLVLPPMRYTCEAILDLIRQTGAPPLPPNAMQCAGLIDTGTTQTALTPQVIQDLRLASTEPDRHIAAQEGQAGFGLYTVDILLSFPDGIVFLPLMSVFGLPGEQREYGPFHVLIGLDILCRGSFAMSGDGHFTLELT